MSTKKTDDLNAKLAKLSDKSRARVEEVLRVKIDEEIAGELAANIVDPGVAEGKVFSRGIIFSRVVEDRPERLVSRPGVEDVIARDALTMDDEKFEAFTKRLTKLKNIKDG